MTEMTDNDRTTLARLKEMVQEITSLRTDYAIASNPDADVVTMITRATIKGSVIAQLGVVENVLTATVRMVEKQDRIHDIMRRLGRATGEGDIS